MGFTSTFTLSFFIMMIICLIISSIGFYKFVYFISLGYGFSIAALGIALLVLFHQNLSAITIVASCLFIVYGCRLGGYLLMREIKSASYRKVMTTEIKDGSDMNVILKAVIWIFCALLYVFQVSPVFFRLQNGGKVDGVTVIGVVIMACGILLESTADLQKSKAKKKEPGKVCRDGLYRIVRCPNYLGEIVFWSGVLISGGTALHGVWQWGAAILGYLCIVYIMFGGARRLELRQNKNYGTDEEYLEYVKKTPIIIPLVPLFSVAKYKWLVG